MTTHLQGEAVAEGWRPFRRRRSPEIVAALPRPLSELRTSSGRIGDVSLFAGIALVAGTELRNLLASPGLYLFGALILLQTFGGSLLALGAFQTEVLAHPRRSRRCAASTRSSLLLGLLLMFYTVESLEREQATGLAPISFSTPVRTASILFGKALANSLVGVVDDRGHLPRLRHRPPGRRGRWGSRSAPSSSSGAPCWCPRCWSGPASSSPSKPSRGSRYATYGLGLAAICPHCLSPVHERHELGGELVALGHAPVERHGDLRDRPQGPAAQSSPGAEPRRALRGRGRARLRGGGRRTPSAGSTGSSRPPCGGRLLRLLPFVLVPLVTATVLGLAVQDGFQGGFYEKKAHDYWKQNLATWKDAPQPAIADADVDLELEPERRWLHSRGSFELVNDRDVPLQRFALTGGPHWKKVHWTMDGKPYKPENRSGLYVFTPPAPLPPGGPLRVGFDFEGAFPQGITKNGGGTGEFILPVRRGADQPSAPSFVPVVGYMEEIGKKEETDYESKDYPDDFYQGTTEALFGVEHPFTTPHRHHRPGRLHLQFGGRAGRARRCKGGERTVVWETDHPVRLFNVVAGRWDVRRGEGTAIYYHPGHAYNIDEMIGALDAARKYYSEWFRPFPWHELKLSRVPRPRDLRPGIPDQHHLLRGHRLPHQERRQDRRRVPGHRPRGRAPVVGQHPHPGQGAGREHPLRGDVPLLDRAPLRAGQGPRRPASSSASASRRTTATSAGPTAERPLVKIDGTHAGRHDRHLRQGGLGLLDARAARWAARGCSPACSDFIDRLGQRPGPPRAPGLHRRPASLRARSGGLRRIRAPVVPSRWSCPSTPSPTPG